MGLSIGEVARRAGCSVPTIRYYEEIGLLPPVPRLENGRRSFGMQDVSRLRFIRRSRDFGLSIAQLRELLGAGGSGGRPCQPARSIMAARLAELELAQKELARLQQSLRMMIGRCDEECGPDPAQCTIFDDLNRDNARS